MDYVTPSKEINFRYYFHNCGINLIGTHINSKDYACRRAFLMRIAISAAEEGRKILYFGKYCTDYFLQTQFASFWKNTLPNFSKNVFFRCYSNLLNFHDLKVIVDDIKSQQNVIINTIIIEDMDSIDFTFKDNGPELILEIGKQSTIQQDMEFFNKRKDIMRYEQESAVGVYSRLMNINIVGGVNIDGIDCRYSHMREISFINISDSYNEFNFRRVKTKDFYLSYFNAIYDDALNFHTTPIEAINSMFIMDRYIKQNSGNKGTAKTLPIDSFLIDIKTNKLYKYN